MTGYPHDLSPQPEPLHLPDLNLKLPKIAQGTEAPGEKSCCKVKDH